MILAIRQVITGTAVPIPGNDIDTDRIIPARFLKEITFEKMGDYLFSDARFASDGTPKDHPLNNPAYTGARIMVVGENFGCGSSREHAPQAIMRYGIAAIIGESFAEIFAGNCRALGVPVVTADPADIQRLMTAASNHPGQHWTLDLASKTVSVNGQVIAIELPESRRQAFLMGTWDATALLRQNEALIRETADRLPYISGFTAA